MASGITRVRLEAKDETANGVQTQLLAAWTSFKEFAGGEWEIEKEQVETTKDGYWGFLTVRRKHGGQK